MNSTTDNQATHCILALGLAAGLINAPNRTLVQMVNPRICGDHGTPPAVQPGLGTIRGQVIIDSVPRPNVVISLQSGTQRTNQALTDGAGEYVFANLPRQVWTVEAGLAGLFYVQDGTVRHVDLTQTNTATVDFIGMVSV